MSCDKTLGKHHIGLESIPKGTEASVLCPHQIQLSVSARELWQIHSSHYPLEEFVHTLRLPLCNTTMDAYVSIHTLIRESNIAKRQCQPIQMLFFLNCNLVIFVSKPSHVFVVFKPSNVVALHLVF